jgi:hypothetical protein
MIAAAIAAAVRERVARNVYITATYRSTCRSSGGVTLSTPKYVP